MQQDPLFDDDQVVVGEPSLPEAGDGAAGGGEKPRVPCQRCKRPLTRDRSRRRRHGDDCWKQAASEGQQGVQAAVW
jgi:hypothetical protein